MSYVERSEKGLLKDDRKHEKMVDRYLQKQGILGTNLRRADKCLITIPRSRKNFRDSISTWNNMLNAHLGNSQTLEKTVPGNDAKLSLNRTLRDHGLHAQDIPDIKNEEPRFHGFARPEHFHPATGVRLKARPESSQTETEDRDLDQKRSRTLSGREQDKYNKLFQDMLEVTHDSVAGMVNKNDAAGSNHAAKRREHRRAIVRRKSRNNFFEGDDSEGAETGESCGSDASGDESGAEPALAGHFKEGVDPDDAEANDLIFDESALHRSDLEAYLRVRVSIDERNVPHFSQCPSFPFALSLMRALPTLGYTRDGRPGRLAPGDDPADAGQHVRRRQARGRDHHQAPSQAPDAPEHRTDDAGVL